jgi:hypothetical protein
MGGRRDATVSHGRAGTRDEPREREQADDHEGVEDLCYNLHVIDGFDSLEAVTSPLRRTFTSS